MELKKRKKLRLENHDYSEYGYYFITLCTHNRQRLFEKSIFDDDFCVIPSEFISNKIVEKWLIETENKFYVKIDQYVIMPDHIHVIFDIDNFENAERHTGRSLQDIMKWFKTMTTNEFIKCVKDRTIKPFEKHVWQKSYYDHIIRNDDDYIKTLNYIFGNPLNPEKP